MYYLQIIFNKIYLIIVFSECIQLPQISMILAQRQSSAQKVLGQTQNATAQACATVSLTIILSFLRRNVLRPKVRNCCLQSGTDEEVVWTVPGDSSRLYIEYVRKRLWGLKGQKIRPCVWSQLQFNVIIMKPRKEVQYMMRKMNTRLCFLRIGFRHTDKFQTRPDQTRTDQA